MLSKFLFLCATLLLPSLASAGEYEARLWQRLEDYADGKLRINAQSGQDLFDVCGALVLHTFTEQQRSLYLAGQDDGEYDFRVNFCAKAVVNVTIPQPEFSPDNQHLRDLACSAGVDFITTICVKFLER